MELTKDKLEDIIKKHNLSDAQVRALISAIKNPRSLNPPKPIRLPQKHTKILLLSDTHLNSRYADLDVLYTLYEIGKKEKVDFALHCGDLTEGEYHHRAGHVYEVLHHGIDEIVDYVVKTYPEAGFKTYFIIGNHDETHFKHAGVDIGKHIAKRRPDMIYLGNTSNDPREGEIKLGKHARFRIIHPGKGTSYSIMYQTQKYIESIIHNNPPQVVAVGHYHKIGYVAYQGVHAFLAGSTQRQTPWMKTKNLSSYVGGWILDIYVGKNGKIHKIKQQVLYL